nr:hypothetical protein [Deltaproteobacteria bacterium]
PTEEPQIVDQPPPTPDRDQDPAPSRGLVIGGAVCLSLGAAGVGLMAAGLGIGSGANDISALDPDDVDSRRSQFDRGRMGNALAIAGGVSAGVLVVTGAVLLGMGISKRRRVALTPTLGPHGPAMVVRGRF